MKVKPLIELAPVPDMDVLFGNIEELKTKYEEQVAQFSKAQEVNKARLDQALQDKLQARRIRKQAIELQDTTELAKGVTSDIGKLFQQVRTVGEDSNTFLVNHEVVIHIARNTKHAREAPTSRNILQAELSSMALIDLQAQTQ